MFLILRCHFFKFHIDRDQFLINHVSNSQILHVFHENLRSILGHHLSMHTQKGSFFKAICFDLSFHVSNYAESQEIRDKNDNTTNPDEDSKKDEDIRTSTSAFNLTFGFYEWANIQILTLYYIRC